MGNKFEIYCMNSSGESTNLTPLIGKIEWSDSVDELAMKLQFNVAYNDDRFFPKSPVEIGSTVTLEGEKGTVGEFVVIEEERKGRGEIPYIAMDYAWYLNKSKETYQFNGIPAKQAIEEVCRKIGVTIGKYSLPEASITKIYFDKTHSDVLKDILEYILQETGEVCRMRMEGKKIFFYTNEEEYIKPVFKFTPAVKQEFSSLDAISNPSKRLTIEETRNAIKIIINENEQYRLITDVKDDKNIEKFGLLQEIISIDAAKSGDAEEIAKNKLKELNRIFEEISIQLPGDENIKAGKFMEVDEPITGIVDKYMIASSTHIFEGGVHTCSVTLKSKATLEAENAGAVAESLLGKEVPEGGLMGEGGELVGGSIEEKIWFFLKGHGFSEAAIAGILGNFYAESRFNVSAIEHGSGAGFGLAQWTGPRRTALNNFAKARGASPSDLQTQLDFLIYEMNGPELWRFGSKAGLEAFKKMTNPTQAAKYFSDHFEAPGIPHMNTRTSKAQEYYNKLKGKQPPTSVSATGKRAGFINAAKKYNGVQYVYGAAGSNGIDCSGLIMQAMKSVGLKPNGRLTTRSMPSDPAFTKISKSQLQPGDILWTQSPNGHVAIYMGNGKTFEATPPRVGTYNMNRNTWQAYYRIKGT